MNSSPEAVTQSPLTDEQNSRNDETFNTEKLVKNDSQKTDQDYLAKDYPAKRYIAFFLPTLDGGGAERVVLRLAEGFAQRGWRVDLVVARAVGAYATQLPSTIHLVDFQTRFPQVLTKTLALARYLRSQQPDVLLTTLDIVNAGSWAQRLSNSSTKIVMVVQTHLSQQFRDHHSSGMQYLRSQLVKQFYPWAAQIIAVSKGVAKDVSGMMKISSKQIHVIYNPIVQPSLFTQAAESLDHPWFAEGQLPVFIGVGRIVKQKDFSTLIRAFALVRQQRPCRLVILGDTDEREPSIKPALEQLSSDLNVSQDISFLGFVENPYKYVARARMLVLSSIYEGFGNVIAEALAVGTPVVATDCDSGPAEILGQGQFGRLTPVGDSSALAIAMIETLNNPLAPEILKERASCFTVEASIAQYYKVIESMVDA